MKIAFPYLLFLLLVFFPFRGMAQWGPYTRYTIEDGLPTNYVYGVLEDDDGIIWAYTEEGIARFNGKEFEVFNTENGLPVNDIFLLRKDAEGRLFPGCFNCPAFYLEDGEVVIPQKEKHIGVSLLPKHRLNGNIVLYDRKTSNLDTFYRNDAFFYQVDEGWFREPYPGDIIDLEKVLGGANYYMILWFIEDGLKVHFSDTSWTIPVSIEPKDMNVGIDMVGLIFNNHTSDILFCSPNFVKGLDVDSGNVTEYDPADLGFGSVDVLQGRLSVAGDYHIFSNNGFVCLDKSFNAIDSFFPKYAKDIQFNAPYTDSKGHLWLGSKNAGLFFFRAIDKEVFSYKGKGLGDNTFRFFRESDQGKVVAVTDQGEVWEIDPKRKSMFLLNKFEHAGRLRYMTELKSNTDSGWCIGGHYNSVFLSREDYSYDWDYIFGLSPQSSTFLSNSIDHLQLGKSSVFSFRSGPEYYNWGEKSSIQILPRGRAVDMALDSTRQLFIVYSDGLYKGAFGGTTLKKIVDRPFIGNVQLSVSPDNTLWISENDGSLHYLEADSLVQISGFSQLANELFWEKKGSLWVASNEGLFNIQFENKKTTINQYTRAHGLSTEDVVSVFVNEEYIYAGHDSGFDVLNRDVYAVADDFTPKLNVREIVYGPERKKLTHEKSIPFRDNSLFIDAELLSYESRGDFYFEYQLTESDTTWIKEEKGQINLRTLPAGKYNLKIRGVDAFGNVSETFSRKFYIRQVWYLQSRFLGSMALILIALSLYASRVKNKRDLKRLAREKELESNMSRLKLQALRSQMNPHFVFNALGSIQYYIQKREVEKADEYLSDFAALVRLILESSQTDMIRFDEEQKLLRLYIGLEHIRFAQHFDYTIIVDPEIDGDFKVPSMLIQPFVENAINHGLYHLKARKGKLLLEFSAEDDNTLIILIEDNGVGREAAAKLRKKGHKSRGMQLINEQLETLKSLKHFKAQIETIDLKDQGKPAGTRVLIKLAYI